MMPEQDLYGNFSISSSSSYPRQAAATEDSKDFTERSSGKPAAVNSSVKTAAGPAVSSSSSGGWEDRVRNLLRDRQHGLYVRQVEAMYEKSHGAGLPADWFSQWGALEISRTPAGVFVKLRSGHVEQQSVQVEQQQTVQQPSEAGEGTIERSEVDLKPGLVFPRLAQLLAGRQHGLFSSQLEKLYQKRWGAQLGPGWLAAWNADGGIQVTRETGTPLVKLKPADSVDTVSTVTSEVERLSVKTAGETGLDSLIMRRLAELLSPRVHGLFALQVETLYSKRWAGEQLPDGWVDILERERRVQVVRPIMLVRWSPDTHPL